MKLQVPLYESVVKVSSLIITSMKTTDKIFCGFHLFLTYLIIIYSENVSLLSLFMNTKDKRKPENWTPEERERVVKVFEWLLKEDKKQNPHLYKKPKRSSRVDMVN